MVLTTTRSAKRQEKTNKEKDSSQQRETIYDISDWEKTTEENYEDSKLSHKDERYDRRRMDSKINPKINNSEEDDEDTEDADEDASTTAVVSSKQHQSRTTTNKRSFYDMSSEDEGNCAFKYDNFIDDWLSSNRTKINRTVLNNYRLRDEAYKQRLKELHKKLRQLDELALDEYKMKMDTYNNEITDRLLISQTWHDSKIDEINQQYEHEHNQTVREFHDKCKELKDSLRGEYEDKRKLIENEKNSLDINSDISETKPAITRKLRRRGAGNANANGSTPIVEQQLFSSTISTTTSSSYTTTQTHLHQHTIISTSSINNTSVLQNYSAFNERKRRPSPATQLSCQLADDDINEDLKYINKNINQLPSQVASYNENNRSPTK